MESEIKKHNEYLTYITKMQKFKNYFHSQELTDWQTYERQFQLERQHEQNE